MLLMTSIRSAHEMWHVGMCSKHETQDSENKGKSEWWCQQQEIEGQLHRHYASLASLLPLQTETIAMVQNEATYFGVDITSRRPSPMGLYVSYE